MGIGMRGVAGLLGTAAVSGLASWATIGTSPESSASPRLADAGSPRVAGPIEGHATWFRYQTIKQLSTASELVVKGTVTDVAEYPPITAAMAGAAEGAPPIPRQIVTVAVEDVLFGEDPGAIVRVVHALPPKGVAFSEDPEYKAREKTLLFLRSAREPGSGRPTNRGLWEQVGIDGRLRLTEQGKAIGALPNGPEREINETNDLPATIKEAKR